MNFKVGDKVRAFGCDGVVTDIFINHIYSIRVHFEKEKYIVDFANEGKYQPWHKEPSLVLVERPEPEEPLFQWVIKDSANKSWLIHSYLRTEKQAAEHFAGFEYKKLNDVLGVK